MAEWWFCHFDDDNYVNVPRLVAMLGNYSSQQDWYLGKPSIRAPLEIVPKDSDSNRVSGSLGIYQTGEAVFVSMNAASHAGRRPRKISFWFATGGAGFCLSRSLALKMMPVARQLDTERKPLVIVEKIRTPKNRPKGNTPKLTLVGRNIGAVLNGDEKRKMRAVNHLVMRNHLYFCFFPYRAAFVACGHPKITEINGCDGLSYVTRNVNSFERIAGRCLSGDLEMASLMVKGRGGGKFISVGEKIRLPDDVTMGYIIEHLLRKNLTVVEQFHSHLEPMKFLRRDTLRDQISLSYSRYGKDDLNVVKIEGFSYKLDPTRFLSLHCYLFPNFKFCPRELQEERKRAGAWVALDPSKGRERTAEIYTHLYIDIDETMLSLIVENF
ncbi:hypothetical protein RUM44_008773 [Polyplax serrata]|uniref:Fringe-like glycosyltransferase domain-containing protein n=1 Tax=Polyplax serrata TaxID=468196 RepID=A0ABR1BD56_POLSC